MSIIQGSYIKIPKGTLIFENGKGMVHTKRESIAQVDYIDQYPVDWVSGGRVTLPAKVIWAANNKSTQLSNVIETEAPAPRKVSEPKVKEPTLRQRMVKGTKWRLTEEAQVVKEKRVPVKYPNGHVGYNSEKENDFVLPVGTEITITGKASDYGPGYVRGMFMPITATGYAKELLVEFKELNKKPEQVGEAEAIPMFAIWDTAKKQYYADCGWGSGSKIEYTDKLTKAKRFKRLADVRVHALIQTGYYYDLPESWGSVPEWMQCGKSFDVPDTWEIVKFDKLTKNEIARIELVDTFKRSWKLRALTMKYSSAVRKVYSELEKKGKLGDWSTVMMFKQRSDEDDRNSCWTDELSDEQIADINKLMGRFGEDVKIQKSNVGFAVAIKDALTATMIALSYTGDLQCAIIDFTTMEEVVTKNKKTSAGYLV